MHGKRFFIFIFLTFLVTSGVVLTSSRPPYKNSPFYELRIYYAPKGKLEDLNKRFGEHTVKLFEKHGMPSVGYWEPQDNKENVLIYILAHQSKESKDKSWKDFSSDPEWIKARNASEVNGRLVDSVKSILLRPIDYSPEIKIETGKKPRVFEMRTYTTPQGKLNDLHSRFRNHTLKLFSKHGMTHIGYWEVIPKSNSEPNQLIYILAHDSKTAGEQSFKNFREDPLWIEAKKASEKNGSLTDKVESVYMNATDYSPIK